MGVLFGALHAGNPHVTNLGSCKHSGLGCFLATPFCEPVISGCHSVYTLAGTFTLPFFGTSVSGIKIGVTGYELQWKAGALWSGGEYGPEASVLTSAVLLLLFVFVESAGAAATESAA